MSTRLVADVPAICRALAAAAAAPPITAAQIREVQRRLRAQERYDLDDVVAELGIEEES